MRIVCYRTANPAPWFMLNRYPSGIIGAAVRVGRKRLLSMVWGKP